MGVQWQYCVDIQGIEVQEVYTISRIKNAILSDTEKQFKAQAKITAYYAYTCSFLFTKLIPSSLLFSYEGNKSTYSQASI